MRRALLKVNVSHIGVHIVIDRALQHVRGIVRSGDEFVSVQHVGPHVDVAGNQRARSAANWPPCLTKPSTALTASHRPRLSLANAIPSCSLVGTCIATVSCGRFLTNQEITGKSLMTSPIRPAARSSSAASIPSYG